MTRWMSKEVKEKHTIIKTVQVHRIVSDEVQVTEWLGGEREREKR